MKIVKAMPSNKAPGTDKVTTGVLKTSLPVTLPIITNLINHSFHLITFAESWKLAEVTPLLKDKDGDRDDPSNSRPISLLLVLSKVCERSAHFQLVQFLDENFVMSNFRISRHCR